MTPAQYAASPPCRLIPAQSPRSDVGPCGGGSASNGVALTWFEALNIPTSYSMRHIPPYAASNPPLTPLRFGPEGALSGCD
jgi:hypothetical protein